MKQALDIIATGLLAVLLMFSLVIMGSLMVKNVTDHYTAILRVDK